MQINISARHGQLSEATREKITAKVDKLTRYFERLTSIEVTVNLERKESPSVEVLVSSEHKQDFVAQDSSSSLMGSLESVLHKLEQQIKKYKEKIQDHHRTSGSRHAIEPQPEGE